MEVKIHGSSDDLVDVTGCVGADEFDCYQSGPLTPGPLMWRGDLMAPDGSGMRVYGIYDGCWHFSVGKVSEDVPLSTWPIRFPTDDLPNYYTTVLAIDAPEGTMITNIWPTKAKD